MGEGVGWVWVWVQNFVVCGSVTSGVGVVGSVTSGVGEGVGWVGVWVWVRV